MTSLVAFTTEKQLTFFIRWDRISFLCSWVDIEKQWRTFFVWESNVLREYWQQYFFRPNWNELKQTKFWRGILQTLCRYVFRRNSSRMILKLNFSKHNNCAYLRVRRDKPSRLLTSTLAPILFRTELICSTSPYFPYVCFTLHA